MPILVRSLKLQPAAFFSEQLYFEFLPNDRAPHPVSKVSPATLHGGGPFHFYSQSHLFHHHPELVPTGEGRNVDQRLHFHIQLSLQHDTPV